MLFREIQQKLCQTQSPLTQMICTLRVFELVIILRQFEAWCSSLKMSKLAAEIRTNIQIHDELERSALGIKKRFTRWIVILRPNIREQQSIFRQMSVLTSANFALMLPWQTGMLCFVSLPPRSLLRRGACSRNIFRPTIKGWKYAVPSSLFNCSPVLLKVKRSHFVLTESQDCNPDWIKNFVLCVHISLNTNMINGKKDNWIRI